MNRPGILTVLRDVVIFALGVVIVMHELGIYPFEGPGRTLSIPALVLGALFCNGPVVLQAITAYRSGSTSPLPPEQLQPESSSEPLPETSGGGS